MRFSSGYAIFVLVTIFAYTRISFAIRVTQTSGRKNGESFSCSSTLLFVLSASSQSLSLYHYLPAPLLLPSSSSFFVFLLLFLLPSSFLFFLFSPVHVYISFLGCLPWYPRPSFRFKVFDLPLFLSSVFFFFSDSSANIPPVLSSAFFLLFFASPATRWGRFPLRVPCVSFDRVPPVREFSRVDLTGSGEWSVLKLCDKTYMGEQCRILWCVTRLYFVEGTWHRYGIQQRDASGRSCFLTCLTGLFNFYPTNTLINVTVNVRRDSYLSWFSIELANHVSNWYFFSRINGAFLFDSCIIEYVC